MATSSKKAGQKLGESGATWLAAGMPKFCDSSARVIETFRVVENLRRDGHHHTSCQASRELPYRHSPVPWPPIRASVSDWRASRALVRVRNDTVLRRLLRTSSTRPCFKHSQQQKTRARCLGERSMFSSTDSETSTGGSDVAHSPRLRSGPPVWPLVSAPVPR